MKLKMVRYKINLRMSIACQYSRRGRRNDLGASIANHIMEKSIQYYRKKNQNTCIMEEKSLE